MIAPTIAQSGPDAFFEPWKDQATAIGQAVFKADEMANLISASTRSSRRRQEQPTVRRQEGPAAGLAPSTGDSVRATTRGWRTDFLTNMGFTCPTPVASWSAPEDGVGARRGDVLIWKTESEKERAALLADPTVAKLQATIGSECLHHQGLAGAIAFASTLSYPVVADQLPPMLASRDRLTRYSA